MILNFILIQINWFICVLGAARGMEWIGVLSVSLTAGLHLIMFDHKRFELTFFLIAMILGWFIDAMLMNAGAIMVHTVPMSPWGFVPFMIALWVNFSMSFSGCMNWIKNRYFTGIILGFVGGPLAYFSGARLGGISIGSDLSMSLFLIGVLWAFAMGFLIASYSFLERFQKVRVYS